MKKQILAASIAMALISASTGLAQTVTDDFDGYADQAAFDAAWTAGTAAMTLTTTNQSVSGANSIYQGTVAQQSRIEIGYEIPVSMLDFSFSFYDPVGDGSLARTYGMVYAHSGDWGVGLQQLVAIGKYNGIATTKYSGRVAFGSVSWFALDAATSPDRSVGWHEARITGSLVGGQAQYDFYIDDLLAGTRTSTVIADFDWIVMGSGLSSTHGMWYDDVSIMVPEPSSLALSLLGGFGLLAAIRRRR